MVITVRHPLVSEQIRGALLPLMGRQTENFKREGSSSCGRSATSHASNQGDLVGLIPVSEKIRDVRSPQVQTPQDEKFERRSQDEISQDMTKTAAI
eukprot:scaffold6579_cov55-Cyclotella_meneghiniana.AAC.3